MTVYLDYAATSPMFPEAIAAYCEALTVVGNPASIHGAGQAAKKMLEEAREAVAQTLGANPHEVVFTGTGTEAINLAIKGLYWARQFRFPRPRVLVAEGEHHATLDAVKWLENHEGAEIVWVPLDIEGRVRCDVLETVIDADPERVALISVLWANNEVGTIQPVNDIALLAARYGIPLHVDAVAAYGQVPIHFTDVRRASTVGEAKNGAGGLMALSVSAHKIGGPMGIAAAIVSRDATLVPLIHGGGQQRQLRSGTQNVAAAIAFSVAAALSTAQLSQHAQKMSILRDRLIRGVVENVPQAQLNGPHSEGRLPNNVHFLFPGCEGDSLLFLLDQRGIAVSTGSACQAGVPEPSHVLKAIGRSDDEARGGLRITLGHGSTNADVERFLAAIPHVYAQASQAGLARGL